MHSITFLGGFLQSQTVSFPSEGMLDISLRLVHFVAGITWVGLLYFFNLVNVPFMAELDPPTRSRVFPKLMSRAMWWFRWGSVVTVLAGIGYWMTIVTADAHNAGTRGTIAIWSFFGIWTLAFIVQMGVMMSPAEALRRGPILGIIVAVLVTFAAYFYLRINSHGWESSRLLSIGIGGGLGWYMMFNVWGIIWRVQKKLILWNEASATNGTPMPPEAAKLARLAFLTSRINFVLSFPMLFFMGAASHYPIFVR